MLKNKIFLFIFALIPVWVSAQTLASYRNVVKDGYNFWIYTPADYDSTQHNKPYLLFLHGHSLCGNDLSRVRRYGCLDALSLGRDIDAVIIAPQNPGGAWNAQKLLNVVNWAEEHFAGDTNRFYVLGLSLGGFGTFEFVGTYPEKVAAAMALCGGSNLKSHCGLNTVPLYILHGTADRAVPISRSQEVVNAMAECGDTSLLRFGKLPGQSHSALAKIFYIKETYQWLFSHSKTDSPRKVNKDITIDVNAMSEAYQNIDRNAIKLKIVNGMTGTVEEPVVNTESKNSNDNTSSASVHIVKKGDTLYAIARKYHTTVDKLCKINHIKETGILQLGQKIKVK